MVPVVKNPPTSAGDIRDVDSLPGSGRSPREGHGNLLSSILAWRIPWTEEPGGLQSMGLQRVRHDWRDLAFHLWEVGGGLSLSLRGDLLELNGKARCPAKGVIPRHWGLPTSPVCLVAEPCALWSYGAIRMLKFLHRKQGLYQGQVKIDLEMSSFPDAS